MNTLTVNDLIAAYTTDPISPYRKLRHRTRINYEGLLRRIRKDYGGVAISDLQYRTFLEWHQTWCASGIPMAHALMGMVRTLMGFGSLIIRNPDCRVVRGDLHGMRFPVGGHREQVIEVAHIIALRDLARQRGLPMIALAQSGMFDCTHRQKDWLGEWCPMDEPGMSEITWDRYGEKWLRGMRWNEIDDRLVLSHITSKKLKKDVTDLTAAPMVIEELEIMFCDLGENLIEYDPKGNITAINRHLLPAAGPVIVDPDTGRPYRPHKFRTLWRDLAKAVGIPDDVQMRDTRATAITESIDSGVSLEDTRKAATHSDAKQTADYSRRDADAKKRSMQQRAAARNPQPREEVA